MASCEDSASSSQEGVNVESEASSSRFIEQPMAIEQRRQNSYVAVRHSPSSCVPVLQQENVQGAQDFISKLHKGVDRADVQLADALELLGGSLFCGLVSGRACNCLALLAFLIVDAAKENRTASLSELLECAEEPARKVPAAQRGMPTSRNST